VKLGLKKFVREEIKQKRGLGKGGNPKRAYDMQLVVDKTTKRLKVKPSSQRKPRYVFCHDDKMHGLQDDH
jgi:hypothetical protein